jgi:1-acyl-sn-glycerol-3-phosphate acyltransferase
VPVQPVSITYTGLHGIPMGRENRPLYAWYGDMELVDHLWEGLATGPVDLVIQFHEPLTVDQAGGRKNLARIVEDEIRRGQALALAGRAGQTPASAPLSKPSAAQAAE